MNGQQHYEEAERLLVLADSGPMDAAESFLAAAQVHATLAQAWRNEWATFDDAYDDVRHRPVEEPDEQCFQTPGTHAPGCTP